MTIMSGVRGLRIWGSKKTNHTRTTRFFSFSFLFNVKHIYLEVIALGRRGRPFSPDPRKKHYMIRINDHEDDILAELCKMTGMGQADVFRTALELLYRKEQYAHGYPLLNHEGESKED